MGRLAEGGVLLAIAALLLAACGEPTFSDAEKATIQSLSLAALPPLPDDPTNAQADDPAAAALGATLFFDQRMSRDGAVACATCHVIDRQFQDDKPLAQGISPGNRRTMPLAGVAWNDWFFWDGRRDSLWAQALVPLEDQREHGATRTFYAHFIARNFGERFGRIFGVLPDLSALPENAGPFGSPEERAAWSVMPQSQRDAVDRVFADIGKALAAFERSIAPEETRFDHFAAALGKEEAPQSVAVLTEEELAGLKLFIGKANCSTCHTGPRFTDDVFHNTGVPAVPGLPDDYGRESAVAQLAADPFNCLGAYSDAGPEACGELRFMVKDAAVNRRAYKTPSLRGAATRPPYMHAGQFASLEAVVDHYAAAPASSGGISELHPLTLSARERAQLVAFLKTLSP